MIDINQELIIPERRKNWKNISYFCFIFSIKNFLKSKSNAVASLDIVKLLNFHLKKKPFQFILADSQISKIRNLFKDYKFVQNMTNLSVEYHLYFCIFIFVQILVLTINVVSMTLQKTPATTYDIGSFENKETYITVHILLTLNVIQQHYSHVYEHLFLRITHFDCWTFWSFITANPKIRKLRKWSTVAWKAVFFGINRFPWYRMQFGSY